MARRRGRPPGRTEQGEQTRDHLYDTALRLFAERGYEGTTMRAIAREADVSPALLYRYFPGKPAVVTVLYDDLSRTFEAEAAAMEETSWARRVLRTVHLSLGALADHRDLLRAVMPTLLLDDDCGLFSALGMPARIRVRQCFVDAVAGATDAPAQADVVGRLADLAHLSVILFWLLDRSPRQRATDGLLALVGRAVPVAPALLWVPGATTAMETLDALVTDALYP